MYLYTLISCQSARQIYRPKSRKNTKVLKCNPKFMMILRLIQPSAFLTRWSFLHLICPWTSPPHLASWPSWLHQPLLSRLLSLFLSPHSSSYYFLSSSPPPHLPLPPWSLSCQWSSLSAGWRPCPCSRQRREGTSGASFLSLIMPPLSSLISTVS